MDLPSGINGLAGREPIAAALAVGRKGPKGAPIEKDRFHILLPDRRAESGIVGGMRDPHPSFAAFNAAEAIHRLTVPARLCHATEAECFSWRRQAQQVTVGGKALAHPKQRPVCVGNGGETDGQALRWVPAEPDKVFPGAPADWKGYQPITCPGNRCPFAQEGSGARGQGTACKPWMRFLARFDFPARADGKRLLAVSFKYTSGSWNTVRSFVGFFEALRRAAQAMGIDPADVNLMGLPVMLQLQERTDGAQQRRFPVVSIAVAGDGDIIAWIIGQRERLDSARLISSSPVVGLLEERADDIALDNDLTSAGNIPG